MSRDLDVWGAVLMGYTIHIVKYFKGKNVKRKIVGNVLQTSWQEIDMVIQLNGDG